jgi:glycerate-2-kinase
MIDGCTVNRIEAGSSARAKEALRNHDAYNFFNADGESLITTGPTGTNVADVCITLVC